MPGSPSRRSDPALDRLGPWIRWAIGLMLVAYLLSSLELPWKLAAVAFGVAGTIVGAVASVKAFRTPVPVALRVTVPLAAVACLLFTVSAGVQSLFYGPTSDYEDCMDLALTQRSQAACLSDYEDKLRGLEGIIGS